MGADSSFLVYVRGPHTLDDAERALRAHGLDVVRDGDGLAVRGTAARRCTSAGPTPRT